MFCRSFAFQVVIRHSVCLSVCVVRLPCGGPGEGLCVCSVCSGYVMSVCVVVFTFPASTSLSCASVCSLGLLTPVIVGGSGCALIPFSRAVPAFGM